MVLGMSMVTLFAKRYALFTSENVPHIILNRGMGKKLLSTLGVYVRGGICMEPH